MEQATYANAEREEVEAKQRKAEAKLEKAEYLIARAETKKKEAMGLRLLAEGEDKEAKAKDTESNGLLMTFITTKQTTVHEKLHLMNLSQVKHEQARAQEKKVEGLITLAEARNEEAKQLMARVKAKVDEAERVNPINSEKLELV